MNITPLEIRQKVFEKAFRGYDKDEVSAFLNSLSVEWERLNDQVKELKYKLEASQKEVEKLREVENSLFKTLKTAEDTGANMIEQATKTAELHMKETEMKADGLMNEAKSRAKSMIEDAEMRSRMIIADMEDEVRELEQVYRSLDANKTSLMGDLKILANDILQKIDRHTEFGSDIKPHVAKSKELSREVNESNTQDQAVAEILIEKETDVEEKESGVMISEEAREQPQVEVTDTKEENNEVTTSADSEESKQVPALEEASDEEENKGSFFDQFD